MENNECQREFKMRVCVKVSAKGEPHGDFSYRGDTVEELNANGIAAAKEFNDQVAKLRK